MALSKDKLIYDSGTPAEGDSVAAFLRTTAGALTATGAAGALDVNITNGITVNLDGVYAGGNLDPDNVGLITHVRAAAPADTDQTLRSTGAQATSDDVVAANIWGMDVNSFDMLFDGTTWDRARGTAGAQHIHDGGNSITVDAVAFDIRPLTSGTDSVAAVQSGAWTVDVPACNTTIGYGANSVTTTAELVATAVAGRDMMIVQNLGTKAIYIGSDASVTSANGIRVAAGAAFEMHIGPALGLWMIADSGTQDVRFLQCG